jgi:very-short-patch-repair endonuclease
MWRILRGSRLGFKFRREHPIGPYRLDFYCHEALLNVEMDGEQHDPHRDHIRDEFLARHGILTYRIKNKEFFDLDIEENERRLRDDVREIQKLCEERAGRKAWPD